MMLVELKPLFARLNAACSTALESAAGLTLARNHYEIAVEHLLRRLLATTDSDIAAILSHFEIDVQRLSTQLDDELSRLKSGNPGRPVLAGLLTEWVQESWLVASITLGRTRIGSGAMLLALLPRLSYYGAGTRYAETLRGISRDRLIAGFDQIVAGSTEQIAGAFDGSDASTETAARGADSEAAIGRFCEDFTARAAAGNLDPVFGRDSEIRQLVDILARRRKNNPICVGEPGVGKTAVVEGLALRIVNGDVPAFLLGTRLLGLDLGLLEAGASIKGEFENRLRGVIDEIKGAVQPTILFIDEAHMLVGAGGQSGGTDAANLLKPALARGELRTIAATTWSEYKKYFEKDPALARRFQLVKLDEPDVNTTVQILRGLKSHYEAAHNVIVRDDAIVAAAELSDRYITGRLLPDKAIDLLDTAMARVRIGQALKPSELEQLESRHANLQRERVALERDTGYSPHAHDERIAAIADEQADLTAQHDALAQRWAAEKAAADGVLSLRRQWMNQPPTGEKNAPVPAVEGADADAPDQSRDEIATRLHDAQDQLQALQGDTPMVFIDTDADAIARVVSDWTGVPLGKMQRDSASSILTLGDRIKARIRGQDPAIDQISEAIKAANSGLRDPHQPMGVFLLVGPSGVGKTETGLAVADQLFGGEHAVISINMSEFQEKHTISRLVGSPPGYVGYGEGGVLTEAVRKRPYSVVLLDEIEKAHLDVVNLFYQVFDKGTLADGEGRNIDFSNTLIFLTSNLATEEIVRLTQQSCTDIDAMSDAIHPVLVQHFKPALLARMTVTPYSPLSPAALDGIVALKLSRLADHLRATSGITLRFEADVNHLIASRCTEVDSGARNIDFIVRKTLMPTLSETVLTALADGQPLKQISVAVGDQGQWAIHPLTA